MRKSIFSGMGKTLIIAVAVSSLLGGMASAEIRDIEDRVNINEASVRELAKLPGIGKKKAEDIVAYRDRHGDFNSIEDLKKVKGIGKKILEKIKGHITLGTGL